MIQRWHFITYEIWQTMLMKYYIRVNINELASIQNLLLKEINIILSMRLKSSTLN